MENSNTNTVEETKVTPTIRISDVIELLETGHTREDIATHYGINKADCKRVFEHPKLKGRKTRKVGYVLVDDTEENQEESKALTPVKTEEESFTGEVEEKSDVEETVEETSTFASETVEETAPESVNIFAN